MSSFILKIIASLSMFIDHIGWCLYPQYKIFRIIGRMAMPIFAFQIALGYKKTSSKGKYMLRMFICAILTQIPFMLLLTSTSLPNSISSFTTILDKLNWTQFELNICFTFLIALGILWLLENAKQTKILYVCVFYLALISTIVPMDYGLLGVGLVIIFYYFGEKKWLYTTLIGIFLLVHIFFDKTPSVQSYMFLAFPLLYLYNGKKGKGMKYFFYAFYPLHMILLVLAKLYLFT